MPIRPKPALLRRFSSSLPNCCRYFRPAYFGDGWVGIRLDLGDTDWDAIGEWIARSWSAVAPKRLTKLIDVAGEF